MVLLFSVSSCFERSVHLQIIPWYFLEAYHSTTVVFIEVPPKHGNTNGTFFGKCGFNYFSSLKNETPKYPQNMVNYTLSCKCYFTLLANSTMILTCFRTFTMVTTMVFIESTPKHGK